MKDGKRKTRDLGTQGTNELSVVQILVCIIYSKLAAEEVRSLKTSTKTDKKQKSNKCLLFLIQGPGERSFT